ncbi:MAG: oligosaccharide flippase family protein [Eubacteriales bacterium]
MRRKQNFLQGAAVLAAAVAIVKVIGFIGKIPLVNILGGHGLGHYNIAYSIYSVMLTISTAGLPVAVSKMVAEANALGRAREVRKILRVAMSIFLLIGAVFSIGAFVFAGEVAGLMASKGSTSYHPGNSTRDLFYDGNVVFAGILPRPFEYVSYRLVPDH